MLALAALVACHTRGSSTRGSQHFGNGFSFFGILPFGVCLLAFAFWHLHFGSRIWIFALLDLRIWLCAFGFELLVSALGLCPPFFSLPLSVGLRMLLLGSVTLHIFALIVDAWMLWQPVF